MQLLSRFHNRKSPAPNVKHNPRCRLSNDDWMVAARRQNLVHDNSHFIVSHTMCTALYSILWVHDLFFFSVAVVTSSFTSSLICLLFFFFRWNRVASIELCFNTRQSADSESGNLLQYNHLISLQLWIGSRKIRTRHQTTSWHSLVFWQKALNIKWKIIHFFSPTPRHKQNTSIMNIPQTIHPIVIWTIYSRIRTK